MKTAKGTIEHNNWKEEPYYDQAPLKSTEARIDCIFQGDIEAKAVTRYLLQYPTAQTCHYSGYLVVDGAIGGKSGRFVIYEIGDWMKGLASSRWQIVEGSGTDGLTGLKGHGQYQAEHDKTVRYELSYEL